MSEATPNLDEYVQRSHESMRQYHQHMQALINDNMHVMDTTPDELLATGFQCSGMVTLTGYFFMKIDISLNYDNQKFDFTGSAGALGAGTGTAWGNLVSWVPLDQVVGKCSFECHFTPVYIGLNFYHNNARFATFNAGGVGIAGGVGGGTGNFFLQSNG